MAGEDDRAPGWEAIDGALGSLYPDQKPLHWGPVIHYVLGGPDPIDGISAYRHPKPPRHWHFVTYGFSELYAKEGSDPTVSGYGFELTFRLKTDSFDSPPAPWALSFLQNLARYVFSSGNAFDIGHYMHLNSPIALGADTAIWAIAFAADPDLPPIDSPHGRVQFLQVVGITEDELSAMKAWDTEEVLKIIEPQLPLLVTDLARESLLTIPDVAEAVSKGTAEKGSSTAYLFVGAASWRLEKSLFRNNRLELTLGANGVRDFRVVLPGRIPHARGLTVASQDHSILLVPASTCGWTVEDERTIAVQLTREAAHEIARAVLPRAGSYRISAFPDLVIRVVKSEIKDRDGNVVEVIG